MASFFAQNKPREKISRTTYKDNWKNHRKRIGGNSQLVVQDAQSFYNDYRDRRSA